MARRSAHTPDELREKILNAAQGIIERDGLVGLSAREIARIIGYSPGTLYNIFENLDDVLITLQVNMLSDVREKLESVEPGPTPQDTVKVLAGTYLRFAIDNKYMWNLLFTHNMPQNTNVPRRLIENVEAIATVIEKAMAKIIPNAPENEIRVAAKTLWASVHGISAVTVTEKGPALNMATAHLFVENLVTNYLRGLTCTE